jgi:xyloglucan-specific exo-beta-1,4-glucanase
MNKKITSFLIALTFMSTFTAISTPSTITKATTIVASPVHSTSYTWNHAQIVGGGYIPSVIFNQSEKDLIYLRTDMGGAYRWNPKTNSWIQLLSSISSKDWNYTGVESLATDPVDPNRVYIAAGTYDNSWAGNGEILRSTDRGDTWQSTKLPIKFGGNMPGRSVGERMTVDPNDDSIIYLGCRDGNGLWKSTDYGVTWNKADSFTAVGDVTDPTYNVKYGVSWVVCDPTSSTKGKPCQTIYAGVANSTNTIIQSTDGGATWKPVLGQPNDGYYPIRAQLASTGFLYISYSNGVGPYDGSKGDVWKYNTKGGQWTNISPVPSKIDGKDNSADGWGYGGLAVDAQHPDTLLTTTMNEWWPDANIYRSTDGGKTWEAAWNTNNYPTRSMRYTQDISEVPWLNWGYTTATMPQTPVKVGWMMGCIQIDPFNSNRMMYGTGATLFGSTTLTNWDNPNKKFDITSMAKGIEECAINDLISPSSGAHLISGVSDIGGFVHTDLTKAPKAMMENPIMGGITSLDYAQLQPNIIVRVGDKAIAYSKDNGSSWTPGTSITGLTGGGKVALSADGKLILWSPAGNNVPVSYSSDNGITWKSSSGIPSNADISSDRVNPKKFYAFANGKFYLSTDGGATFATTKAAGLPTKGSVYFKAIPGVENDIWLVSSDTTDNVQGIYHSTDAGASFKKLSNTDSAAAIGFGKAAPGKKYMAIYISGTINGVDGIFRSDDAGKHWVRINDDQHQYASTSSAITGDPRIYGRVYIGTNGFGIVYGDISTDVNKLKVVNVDDKHVTVNQGQKYKLPTTVYAYLADGTVKDNMPVDWHGFANTSKPGTKVFKGTITGYKGTVLLTLTINPTGKTSKPKHHKNIGFSTKLYSEVESIIENI